MNIISVKLTFLRIIIFKSINSFKNKPSSPFGVNACKLLGLHPMQATKEAVAVISSTIQTMTSIVAFSTKQQDYFYEQARMSA